MSQKSQPNQKIKLAMLEDVDNMLIGLKFQFDQPDIDICLTSDETVDFLKQIEYVKPDVALIDLRLWRDSDAGLVVIEKMKVLSPYTRVVVYTAYPRLENFYRAMALDVKGFVKKEHDAKPAITLVDIVRMVANGGEYYDQDLFKEYKNMLGDAFHNSDKALFPSLDEKVVLTEREKDVLRCIAKNMSNSEIADSLVISVNTVKVHKQNIFEKFNVHTKREALIIAKTKGLI
jgi:NarL family two-component system response regulator LiaR